MAREWKPGDVAINTATGKRALFMDIGGVCVWKLSDGTSAVTSDYARPLVVIDPEDREQVERLESDLAARMGWMKLDHTPRRSALQAALRELADPTPPKPEEPTGLGAVVEDDAGHVWVRIHESYGDHLWRMEVPNTCAETYATIAAVRVLSEGVTP